MVCHLVVRRLVVSCVSYKCLRGVCEFSLVVLFLLSTFQIYGVVAAKMVLTFFSLSFKISNVLKYSRCYALSQSQSCKALNF